MKRFSAWLVVLLGLLSGLVAPAQAQRGRYRGRGHYARPVPRRYYRVPAHRSYYGPRYYHAAPYRGYGGRSYYRPRPYYRQPGPAIISRP